VPVISYFFGICVRMPRRPSPALRLAKKLRAWRWKPPPEDCAAYLEAAFVEAPEDEAYLVRALGEVARARQDMSQVARDAGLSRAGLHKALSAEGDPRLSTLLKVLRALGLRVHIGAIKADA